MLIQRNKALFWLQKSMLVIIQRMEAHRGPTSKFCLSFMHKVAKRIDAMKIHLWLQVLINEWTFAIYVPLSFLFLIYVALLLCSCLP